MAARKQVQVHMKHGLAGGAVAIQNQTPIRLQSLSDYRYSGIVEGGGSKIRATGLTSDPS